jgi:hypothetical protein
METKQLSIDVLSLKLANDVVDYIHNWMRGNHAEEIDFHRYRMKLLTSFHEANSVSEKIIMLANKASPTIKFDVVEAVSDKIMGESMARYIFGKVMIRLNEEFKKILEHEVDKTSSEISNLHNRVSGLKTKIGQH